MAKVMTQSNFRRAVSAYNTKVDLAKKIKKSLVEGFRIGGVEVKASTEPVSGTKLLRVSAISTHFSKLRPSERQDLAWRILSEALTRDEQLHISMVLTLTPAEASGIWED